MDLNVLFAKQVGQLQQCYFDLGHPPQRLQQALQSAVEQELSKTLEEVREANEQIAVLERQCEAYKQVLSADGAQIASSSSREQLERGTLTARIESWQAELSRMERQYSARRSHVDKLIASLDVYRPILGDFVPEIVGSNKPFESNEADHVQPIPSLRLVETSLGQCTEELQRRTDALQADMNEILQLWAEMALLPSSDDDLDARIQRHLGVTPRLVDVGEGCMDFCGDFDEIHNGVGRDDDDDGDAEIASGSCDTPSRKTNGHTNLSLGRPGAMLPTLDNLTRVQARRAELDDERTRRTETMQALYDELIPLWQRFDVADEDVDAFVQANCGCSLTVLEAYESELRQMRELKSQHMALFIVKVREDIDQVWDQLMMTPEERRDSFAPFFYDLSEDGSSEGGIDPSDELLALHEEKMKTLQDELATRARPLELVRQYMRLLDEAKALEESAKDTSRLTGRGAPGQRRDPGRLLREEKMRKRIKVLKPKVEEDLLRTIPAWEEESGRPFIVHGARFLDTIDLHSQQQKKRPRTISQTTQSTPIAVSTPQMPAAKRANVEGSAPRSVSASSTLRNASVQRHPQSTPTAAANMNGARPRHVTGPSSVNALPTPVPASSRSNGSAVSSGHRQQKSSFPTPQMANSSISFANQSTDVTAATTIVLKPSGPKGNNGTTKMQPPALPVVGRTPAKGAPMKRPSLLVEASLRKAPRPSSDYAKPTTSGVGATLRAFTNSGRNDSLGPNWAILPEDEDEENLLML